MSVVVCSKCILGENLSGLCRRQQGLLNGFEEVLSLFPLSLEVGEDSIDDALATGIIGEIAHGALSPSYFPEHPFDDIS